MFAKPVNNTQKKNLTCEMNKTVFSFSYDRVLQEGLLGNHEGEVQTPQNLSF